MPSLDELIAARKARETKRDTQCNNTGCTRERCLNPNTLDLAKAIGLVGAEATLVDLGGLGTVVAKAVQYELGVAAADRAAEKGTEVRPYHMCWECLVAVMSVGDILGKAADHETVIKMSKEAAARASEPPKPVATRVIQWRNVTENI